MRLRVLIYLLYYKARESRRLYSARSTLTTYLRTLKLKGSLQITSGRSKLYIAFINAFIMLYYLILRLKWAIIAAIILNDFNASIIVYINKIKASSYKSL
jgi:hypothetical protein